MIMFRISGKSQPMHRNRSAYHANNGVIIQTFCISMTSFGYLVFCIAYKCNGKKKQVGGGNVEYLKIINIKQVLGEIWRIDNTYFGKCQ